MSAPLGPADFAGFLRAMLSPGGVAAVGTIAAVLDRSPEVPYAGVTPVLFINPWRWQDKYRASHAKMQEGMLTLTYLDSLPSQQGVTLATIESAMWANYAALITAIRADLHWGGTVTAGGDLMEGTANPDGPIIDEAGTPWVSFRLTVAYRGPLEQV